MNEKITLPSLTALLARASSQTKKEAEDFIREFFSLISSTLEQGEPVKVKGIGVFKLIDVEARKSVNVTNGEANEIPAHRKVVFIPAKELAEDVNEPFSMFETVELADNLQLSDDDEPTEDAVDLSAAPSVEEVAEEQPLEPDNSQENVGDNDMLPEDDNVRVIEVETGTYSLPDDFEDDFPESSIESEKLAIVTDIPADNPIIEVEEEELRAEESIDDAIIANNLSMVLGQDNSGQSQDEASSDIAADFTPVNDEKEYRCGSHSTHRFWVGALCGFITAIFVCAAVLFIIRPFEMKSTASGNTEKQVVEEAVLTETAENGDSPETKVTTSDEIESDKPEASGSPTAESSEKEDVAPTQPSDEKVYDTITKTRYLTTMAQDHYGNFNFWPYIYKENQSILGHPDRIKPGTKVVVPPLSKYGVKVSNPADVKEAKRLGVEIYSRYK